MSALKTYLDRSMDILRRSTAQTLRANPNPKPGPLSIFSFNSAPLTPLSHLATGSDVDIGGVSTCALTPVPAEEPGASDHPSHVAFHGNLSLFVPPEYRGRIRTGYAAFRNRTRPTFFGEDTWDLELYSHLRVEVAYRGWEQWRGKWVCNLQSDGPVRSDLFQHRLDLPATYATPDPAPLNPATATGLNFAVLHLPLTNFVLTNSGKTSETQVEMLRKIRTVGFALLGGGRNSDAPSDALVAAAHAGHKMGAGGWGRPSGDEAPDAEMEELMGSDLGPAAKKVMGKGGSGYHRVGAVETADAVPEESGEGYFELCVRSVEAVRYDPEEE